MEKEGEINSLLNTLSTAFVVDPQKRYILITDNPILKDVLPKNILVLPEKYTDLNLVQNMKVQAEERSEIENWLLQHILNVPIDKDIISFKGDKTVLGGRLLTPPEVNQIRNEVKVLRKMKILGIIQSSLIDESKKMMFENSRSYEDMRAGKLILYALDVQNNILKNIERETLDEKMKKVVQLN